MGGSLIGWVILGALFVIPLWRLLPRFGMPAWAAIFAVIPLGAIVLLWIMAFRDPSGGDAA